MNLLMMRHGEAGSARPLGDDSLRSLTGEGIEKLERQAKQMVKWEIRIDRIVSSPFVRARQTAQVVADAYKMKVVEDDRLSAVNFTLHALGSLLVEYGSVKHLLITGHNPDFSTVLGAMIGGATVEFGKGALACVDVARLNPPAGRLVYFLTPELMSA